MAFSHRVKKGNDMISVYNGDITKLRIVDAISSAANGIGIGKKGVAGAITRAAGDHPCSDGKPFEKHVRDQAIAEGFYEEGMVYVTESGGLINTGIKAVLHAVTMTAVCAKYLVGRVCERR